MNCSLAERLLTQAAMSVVHANCVVTRPDGTRHVALVGQLYLVLSFFHAAKLDEYESVRVYCGERIVCSKRRGPAWELAS